MSRLDSPLVDCGVAVPTIGIPNVTPIVPLLRVDTALDNAKSAPSVTTATILPHPRLLTTTISRPWPRRSTHCHRPSREQRLPASCVRYRPRLGVCLDNGQNVLGCKGGIRVRVAAAAAAAAAGNKCEWRRFAVADHPLVHFWVIGKPMCIIHFVF